MKLGIYGGTFAPIHNAHVRVAKAFLETYSLDKLMVVPTGIPPHKVMSEQDDPKQRLEMCRLAFEGCERIEVSDIEVKRAGKSYTVLTLQELSSIGTDLYLLCGTDMILSLGNWYRAEDIFGLCTIVYARRETDPQLDAKIDQKISEYTSKYGARVEKLELIPLELSSTEVRAEASAGGDISGDVPDSVSKFIKENKLYLSENE